MAPPPEPAKPTPEASLGVFPANWAALRVFLSLATQWRRAGMEGVRTGLDYRALPVVAGALGIPADADLLARLRVLEGEALRVMGEEAERERRRHPGGQG